MSNNGGHTIRKDLVLKGLRAAHLNPSNREFNQAIKEVTFAQPDAVTFEEFRQIAERLPEEENQEELLNECFKRLDRDGNGMISVQEFKDLMTKHGEPLSQSEMNDLLMLADHNHDGKINYSGKEWRHH